MRLAYCEDELIQREYIEKMALEWAELRKSRMDFSGYGSAEEFLFKHEQTVPFDVIFLDIDMKENGTSKRLNGMQLARLIRDRDRAIPILFLTNLLFSTLNDAPFFTLNGADVE